MNIVDFLENHIIRLEDYEGFEAYALEYNNRHFSIKKGEMDEHSVASFYLEENSEVTFDDEDSYEASRDCFIQQELYSSDVLSTKGNEFVEDLLDFISHSCRCSEDCTMESGCQLMQCLLTLKCNANWKCDWAGALLELAEERVDDWIYGC